VKLSEIARMLQCTIPEHAVDIEITALAAPEAADSRNIIFISSAEYRKPAEESDARVVIVKKGNLIPGKICLEVEDPYCAFAKTGRLFEDLSPLFDTPVHETSFIHPTARVHATASVGPFSTIGKECEIGADSIIASHCVIENGAKIGAGCRIDSGAVIRRRCCIGDRVIIQSNAVIGSEGFGNAKEGDKWVRIPSFGTVRIDDDAEIGAGVAIDRGALGDTIIGKGVKIDNLCHIAHNVVIGENSAIAAQTGISGSTKLGKRVGVFGQAGFVGHIEIGDDAIIGAKAGVSKSVETKAFVTGYPARDLMTMRRIEAAQQRLPELLKEVKRLRKEINSMTQIAGRENTQ
jgi:UDP-3-O-[3-hydroxymyristoyl] glucosamine N-acyltransferase